MTFDDSSSIILIIGAIAILAFLVHGLWFSGKSINRKLEKNSKEDQAILNSSAVGKVRIIVSRSDSVSSDPQKDLEKFETFTKEPRGDENGSMISKTSKPKEIVKEQVCVFYEMNLHASEGREYKGLDLEELFANYGFIRGDNDIFCVYEDPNEADRDDRLVFRICSLEPPYCFPKKMDNFTTKSLAIYMQLPPKGRAFVYFKAMRIAANCLMEHLGGTSYDNDNVEYTEERLDAIEQALDEYDKSGD